MSCSNKLRADGLPYPKTCEDCGLGPCKRELEGWADIAKAALKHEISKDIRAKIADLNEAIERAIKEELIVSLDIFPHKDTKAPRVQVQITEEVQ